MALQVGPTVVGQMDALQDQADSSLLVFSPEYLASAYCVHEMDRAVARGAFLPVLRNACVLPKPIPNHLYADLQSDDDAAQWQKMLDACGADLGCGAPDWLRTLDDAKRYLTRGDSVNLVVSGKPKWRELITRLESELAGLRRINLDDGKTAERPGLVREILRAYGDGRPVPESPKDLGLLSEFLGNQVSTLAFLRFENVVPRDYGFDFFANLRFHLEERNLTMLIESRVPFASLLPQDHPMSTWTNIKQIELRGR